MLSWLYIILQRTVSLRVWFLLMQQWRASCLDKTDSGAVPCTWSDCIPIMFYSMEVEDTQFSVPNRYSNMEPKGVGAQGMVWWVAACLELARTHLDCCALWPPGFTNKNLLTTLIRCSPPLTSNLLTEGSVDPFTKGHRFWSKSFESS